MADFMRIFTFIRMVLFGLTVFVALIYSAPIVCLRRFHYRNNMLTINICVATILCSLYWFVFYLMLELYPFETLMFLFNNCAFASIFPVLLTLQVPLSFVTASVNRLCAVVYNNRPLFKKKRWLVICILAQWVFGTVLTVPIFFGIGLVSREGDSHRSTRACRSLVLHQSTMGGDVQVRDHRRYSSADLSAHQHCHLHQSSLIVSPPRSRAVRDGESVHQWSVEQVQSTRPSPTSAHGSDDYRVRRRMGTAVLTSRHQESIHD